MLLPTSGINFNFENWNDILVGYVSTPLTDHQGFRPTLDPGELGFDKSLDADVDKQWYQEAIGLLNYAAVHTRPDLLTTVSLLSGYTYRPS
ncbi:hypothetical protein HK096_007460, partial [Nowakowskiella sp. JEL0078]